MKRLIYSDLFKWKERTDRKPLILLGARQVGKTYILKEFGQREFRNVVYVNCHGSAFAKGLFHDFSVQRIVTQVSRFFDQPIEAGQTLLIFDEIQEVSGGIASLKYFCEDMPELHVVAAGSLLGISLHQGESYPVGKVNTLNMYPMTFGEFVLAQSRQGLYDALVELNWDVLGPMHEEFTELLRQYYFTGGMPEVVKRFIETGSISHVREMQHEILKAYEMDISKHTSAQAEKIRQVWWSIPAQLARENKKFIFGAVRKGGRAVLFEESIQWLVDAGLAYRVERCVEPRMPLKFYADNAAFKLYALDCGLLACMAEANPNHMLLGMSAFVEFKGAFAENFVLQQLKSAGCRNAYYYSKEKSTMEVDFLFQTQERVVPVEVKAEVNVKSKSLSTFVHHEFADSKFRAVRFSMRPYINQDWMENVPLYAAESYIKALLRADE